MSKNRQSASILLKRASSQVFLSMNKKTIDKSQQMYKIKPPHHTKMKSNNNSYYKKYFKNMKGSIQDISKTSRQSHLYYSKQIKQSNPQKLIKRFISPSFAEKKQIKSVRTFSPSAEFISSQLSFKKQEKQLAKKQVELVQRMELVLEHYRKSLKKQKKQKQQLAKENNRLKAKLARNSIDKKYQHIHEYNV